MDVISFWSYRVINFVSPLICYFYPLLLSSPVSSLLQHVDIAALLIKFNTCVNATDKWAFTPLHEAAQKGRTQLCALLLAHGADPTMKNQEGQTALDLATVTRLDLLLLEQLAMPQNEVLFFAVTGRHLLEWRRCIKIGIQT